VLSGLWSGIESESTTVLKDAGAFPGEIIHLYEGANEWLLDKGEALLSGLWSGIKTEGVTVLKDAEAFPGEIIHLYAEADTWLVDAGEQLLEGLWTGIENKAKGVLGDVEGVGKKVVDDLTHPWSILSPSKVTAEKGGYLVQGISVGMKAAHPALLADVDKIGQSVISEFSKMSGQDVGHSFMVNLAHSFTSDAHLVESAFANMVKGLSKSSATGAFADGMNFGTKGGQPLSPGSSVTHNYNMPNARIEANDPGQLARQLDMRARRKNSVRT
jgi:hypothetical protein